VTNTLLAVCAANICRSPLALAALDQALMTYGFRRQIVLRSRGEQADPGRPVCEHALRVAQRHDLDTRLIDSHRAVLLDRAELRSTDLILTADRTVRAAVLKLDPRLAQRTFTFREAAALARLVSSDPEDDADRPRDLAGFAAALNDNRGLIELPALERAQVLPWHRLKVHSHDVPDAHVDAQVSHRVVYRTLVPAVQELVGHLTAYASVRQR
jgi:protein-tyrosine phosphatase